MAITGQWKSRQSIQAGARKWGTGVNTVHAINSGDGRNIAPGTVVEQVPDELAAWHYQDDGWADIWHDGELPHETGMDQRARWGQDSPQLVRDDARNFPQWGPYVDGVPGGTEIRTEKHGYEDNATPNQVPTETVSEGWLNKVTTDVDESVVSDTSQLLMKTSMTQLHKERAGSQRGSGSASEYSAGIRQSIPGKILKAFSGGQRHYDMAPRQQTQSIRPFWNRTAGTADPSMLTVNHAYESMPITRDVPADPYTGETPIASLTDTYGYQDEDMIPYA